MKKVLILFLVILINSCSTEFKVIENPSDYSQVIKRKNTLGVIFSEKAICFLCLENFKRFTPTLDEIKFAEHVLKKNIRKTNNRRANQGGKCMVIHRNLNKYRRQYYGFYNSKNEKVIYATFNKYKLNFWEKIRGLSPDEDETWKKEIEMWLDGCSNHWEVKINLTTEELFEFSVNGNG